MVVTLTLGACLAPAAIGCSSSTTTSSGAAGTAKATTGSTAAASGSTAGAGTSTTKAATTGTTASAAPVATDKVDVKEFAFTPETITVAAGATVTWTNQDEFRHEPTSGTPQAPGSAFTAVSLAGGATGTATLAAPGTYPYYCAVHEEMKGTIIVT